MCVIYFAYRHHPNYPLILAANRDEFYARPTQAARYWDDYPFIFAGRDLVAGGTWLGITRSGRFAAVTNYREMQAQRGEQSRGDLVADFLKTEEPADEYMQGVRSRGNRYSGFNLLVGEINAGRKEMYYFSNRGEDVRNLDAGIYALSNHLLDTPWPKVASGRMRFSELISGDDISKQKLFELLADESVAEDDELPDTGIGYEREKLLSAIFIRTPIYGTRSSTVLTIDKNFVFDLDEKVFG
jgi:uncharacterized protein with NRDE domain